VAAATGLTRHQLRPDLFGPDVTRDTSASELSPSEISSPELTSDIDELDLARAQSYRLLALLLAKPPTQALIDRVAGISGGPTPLGMAWIALADAARQSSEAAVGEEYFKLFIGVGRGDVLPYASFYMAGFLHERPLGAVRADLARIGIERQSGIHEPEDHVATLFEAMAGMIDGSYAASTADQDAFFEAHLKPWAARLFADVAVAPSAKFYRAVADIGGHWIDLETRSLAMAA
jgi:TorA maturation chaperone TorD